jgi:hypothetical protein
MGDFPGIIADAEASLAFEPNDPLSLTQLALARAHTGAFSEAVSAAVEAESLAPGVPWVILTAANVFAIVGDVAGARERLATMENAVAEGVTNVSPGNLAVVYASLGDADRVFDLLNLVIDTFDSGAFSLNNPEFRPYWGDARFEDLLDRLGLPREAYR